MATRKSKFEQEREDEARRQDRLRRRREEKKRQQKRKVMMMRVGLVAMLAAITVAVMLGVRGCSQMKAEQKAKQTKYEELMSNLSHISEDPVECAKSLATQYDYDTALELLQSCEDSETDETILSLISDYKTAKAALISYDVNKIEQVSFHSLIVDEAQAAAMAGDPTVAAANSNTISVAAFTQYLQQIYDQGYVLVRMSDIAAEETDADGKTQMTRGEIWLPEGKTPIVISQTDVTYPAILATAGYASRMVLGEDGTPACEYTAADGSVSTGDYDVVPCLDTFIDEHPDFSYRGARAVIGLKGADGFLGYRTDEEKNSAKPLIEALRTEGFELASNGYGDTSYASTYDQFQADVDAWAQQTGAWIGDVNILLYPYGADIASWTDYSTDNQKYAYLYEKGFRYFSNEDTSNAYMVQIRSEYVRQSRKNAST